MITVQKWNRKNFSLNKESYKPTMILNYDKTLKSIHNFDDAKSPNYIYDLRRAAECHKMVRKYIQGILKPDMKILDICNLIENKITELTKENNLTAGIAFPTGVSLNNIIAHDTANPNDDRIFTFNDICKIDYGIHYNGRIIDCAFSCTFNPSYQPLLQASKEAMWSAIKLAGPDVLCNEISENIKEVIESYEVEINGKTYKIKSVEDLGGHSIDQYDIHSGKLILCSPCKHPIYENMRMDYGQYAIECFASTGTGKYKQGNIINHYSLNKNTQKINYNLRATRDVHNWITINRGHLPFTQRWMMNDPNIANKYKSGLKELLDKKIITGYPPLYDISKSLSSHFEHTIYLHENGKEVLSIGDDY